MVRADFELFGASGLAGVWEVVVMFVFLGDSEDELLTRELP